MKFDLFVSYSDTEIDLANEDILPFLEHNLGQVVCSRERDIPPNLHEISALDTAMRNSQRYIIFLSPDYLQDRLRKNIEAKGIVDLVGSSHARPKDSLLVVKVAQCRIPTWLSAFSLHDWTTHLSREDHLRRLSQWSIRSM
nr:hypothetical protein BaRGS_007181 [Batillaria attramentaria]